MRRERFSYRAGLLCFRSGFILFQQVADLRFGCRDIGIEIFVEELALQACHCLRFTAKTVLTSQ